MGLIDDIAGEILRDFEFGRKNRPLRCPECRGAGWVLDAKTDKEPTTLELLPCIYPPCEFSGREVATLSIYGRFSSAVLHPTTRRIMALTGFTNEEMKMEHVGEVKCGQVSRRISHPPHHWEFQAEDDSPARVKANCPGLKPTNPLEEPYGRGHAEQGRP